MLPVKHFQQNIHEITRRICTKGQERSSVQIEKIPSWSKEITKDVVPEVDTYILSLGFVRSKVDHYVYSKEEGNHFIYVSLYVNNMLLVGSNMDTIKEMKR
jgi:hypothetical protein